MWSLLVTREAAQDNTREIVWVATKNSGLIKLLPYQKIWARFETEQGCPRSKSSPLRRGERRTLDRHEPRGRSPSPEPGRASAADQASGRR